MTLVYKVCFGCIFPLGFWCASIFLLATPGQRRASVPLIIVAVFSTVLSLRVFLPLKRVALSGGELVVSGLGSRVRIPLREVEKVSGSRYSVPELIRLQFRQRGALGSKLLFMAPVRLLPFGPHPLLAEISERASAAAREIVP